jgi:hypothetical protein
VEAAGGLSVKNIGLRLPVAFAALVLLLGGWARADIVTLTNGKTLEGRVTEDGDKVIVELPQGRVKLNKSQVKSITPKVTPQDEHAARSAEIEKAAKDGKLDALAEADKWFELAVWDGQQQLTNARADALNRALALSPAHAGAREMAGFVLHDGQWITRDERNQALGLTKVDGKWVSKEGAADLARIRNDARREELQQLKDEAELKLKEAEAKKAEAQRALAEAQREELLTRDPLWNAEAIYRRYVPSYYDRWRYSAPILYSDFVVVPQTTPVAPPPPVVAAPREDPLAPAKPAKKPVDNSPAYNNGKSNPGYPFLP